MSENVGRIAESWSDEARIAAVNARRLRMGSRVWADTEHYGKGVPAYFHGLTADGRYANIRVEEPDEDVPGTKTVLQMHQEMEQQGGPVTEPEFHDTVHVSKLRTAGGSPVRPESPDEERHRRLTDLANQAVEDNRRRLANVETLPNTETSRTLKAGLRSRGFVFDR